MARQGTTILDSGDKFPELTMNVVGDDSMSVPGDMGDGWKVILLFRGYF